MKKNYSIPALSIKRLGLEDILTGNSQQLAIPVAGQGGTPVEEGDGTGAPTRTTTVTVPFPKVMRN